jgi:hypothetical protein
MGDDVPVRLILRWAVFTGAAIVAAWFVLSWVQARDLGRAQVLVSGGRVSAGQARQASSLLATAGDLNPDRAVDITRAQLAEKQHRPALAVRILESVVQAEPLNLDAWRELSIAAAGLPNSPLRTRLAETAFRKELSLVGHPK